MRAAEFSADTRQIGPRVATSAAYFVADTAFGEPFFEEQLAAAVGVARVSERVLFVRLIGRISN